ncbi:MAG: hypothetical protein PHD15_03485 [Clostridia bacterium]|nr:hypothetical protein [Clostridia bacterium]MDD4386804.1 hypothetical protein [Clostridia bacterium]
MESTVNLECNDLNLILDAEGIISCDFVCYDVKNQSIVNMLVPIHEQIKQIYRNIKLTKDFVKRLEYKLKLTLIVKPAKLTFVNKNGNAKLKTQLCEIYQPVTLTYDRVKIGDNPLIIDGKVEKFFSYNSKIFLTCLIDEIDEKSKGVVQTIKILKINEEVNAIYSDKEAKNKIRNILNIKSKSKKAFLAAIFDYLEGKTLKLEYDEHYEYSLWTVLFDFIVINNDKK